MVVEPLADGEALHELLLAGGIYALLAPKPPQGFLYGQPDIVRLFPDFEAAERAYPRKTGFFPIMHLLAVRSSLIEANRRLLPAL